MDSQYANLALYGLGAVALVSAAHRLGVRVALSRAKHKSLAGHSRLSRRLAALIPFYDFDEDRFFRSDNAPDEIAARRRDGFMRLAELYRQRFAATRAHTAEVSGAISDVQFTDVYRVPFQYSRMVREHLRAGTFAAASSGVTLTDLDGNR